MTADPPPEPTDRRRASRPWWSRFWFQALAMLLLGGLTAAAYLWATTAALRVEYPDLLRMIGPSATVLPPTGAAGVTGPSATVTVPARDLSGRTWTVRDARDLKIDREVVTGTVTAVPDAGEPKPQKFRTSLDGSGAAVRELMTRLEGRRDWTFAEATPWLPGLGTILLGTLLLGGVLMLGTRAALGLPTPFGFGRHRGKMYTPDKDSATFGDVAGIDEAVEEVREVVDFLTSAEKYHKLGGKIPKGVLLVGPPGTGKTLLAKAIAGEARVPFFSMSGSDFVEMYAGVGAARVRDVFEQARKQAPCIIFIDELDALGKNRNDSVGGSGEEREQTLNALLVEMDGFDARTNVIMVAATNRPEILDPALMRPGRFDRQVVVGRPDLRGREAILRVHASDVRLAEEVDLTDIASLTPGFVGADLSNLINEAALLAARKGKSAVGSADVHEGIERLVAGLEKKQRHMDEAIKRRVAGHEAGHAILAACLPDTPPVHKVSIIPRGVAAGGFTMQKPGGDRYLQTRRELTSSIQVLLGGTLAEELLFGDISTGASNDLERATGIATAMVLEYGMSRLGRISYGDGGSPFLAGGQAGPPRRQMSSRTAREVDLEVRRILAEATEHARALLIGRRAALTALTDRLIAVETVTGDVLDVIMEEHPVESPTRRETSPHEVYALPLAKNVAAPITDFENT